MRLAKALDCHLVGVAPTGLIDLPASAHAAASLADFAALAWDTLRDQAERATDRFRDECRAAGVTSCESVVDESAPPPSLVRHAHCSDLTLLAQADPASADYRSARDVVQQVLLYSARPTLILPCAGRFDSIGTRVMVVWDESRESARAVSDALPLLRLAEQVLVMSWNEAGAIDEDAAPALRGLAPLVDMARRLGQGARRIDRHRHRTGDAVARCRPEHRLDRDGCLRPRAGPSAGSAAPRTGCWRR